MPNYNITDYGNNSYDDWGNEWRSASEMGLPATYGENQSMYTPPDFSGETPEVWDTKGHTPWEPGTKPSPIGEIGDWGSFGDSVTSSLETAYGSIKSVLGGVLSSVSSPVDPKNPTQAGSDAMGKIYASAIAAGITGIMGYMNNQDTIKAANSLADRKFEQEKTLLSDKYRREDEISARKGTVANGAQGRINYTNKVSGYQTPGYANQKHYGLLGSAQ